MKRINSKAVQYLGVDIHITMPFVAVDKDGQIHEYEKEPRRHEVEWMPSSFYKPVCEVDLEGLDWKETLREFKL